MATTKRAGWRVAVVLAASVAMLAGGRLGAEEMERPEDHRVDWLSRHQVHAKQDPGTCQGCHTNMMFCVECHTRRDSVQQRVHRRTFRMTHSIEARANPRKCDACHTVDYCQNCHAGKGTSER